MKPSQIAKFEDWNGDFDIKDVLTPKVNFKSWNNYFDNLCSGARIFLDLF